MSSITHYYPGGFNQTAPANNKSEQWSNGTQTGDPAVGYTAWDSNGNVTSQRALTASESSALASQDSAATSAANLASLQTKATNAITANQTYLGIASPSNAQVVAQVAALTRQVDALIKITLNMLTDTAGT